MTYEAQLAETVYLRGHQDDRIDACMARPSPAVAARTEEALRKFGKTYEFHTYENAGHAFFSVDRAQYRVHAAVDGWKKVLAWFGKHLH